MRRVAVAGLVGVVLALGGSGAAQAQGVINCSPGVSAAPDATGLLLQAGGSVTCDAPVHHQIDLSIQTTVRTNSTPLGAGANLCTDCRAVTVSAATALVPGIAYNIGVADFIVAPSGSRIAPSSGCTQLFPSNTAVCAASTQFQR